MPKNETDEIWAAYTKGIKPIGKSLPGKSPTSAKSKISGNKKAADAGPVMSKSTKANLPQTALDHKLERRLKRGDIEIEARLDLHGLHQKEAHEMLLAFIGRHVKSGKRRLLIITGKGRDGRGVLKSSLSGWLAASPFGGAILALRPAAIPHGGGGAFYLLLKRKN